ncbi:MAG: outer membrane protein transport protein [Pseudomonadota bacterium]
MAWSSLKNGASLSALALAATFAWTATADAGGFALRQHSAYYQGMAFAGAATGAGSASSMFWNPATVTEFQGRRFEGHVTGVLTSSTVEADNALIPFNNLLLGPDAIDTGAPFSDSGDIGGFAVVPATYTIIQLTDKLYFANSNNAPFGLGSDQDDDWSGRFHGTESGLRTFTVNPTVAYRFNDMFSAAAGVQVMYSFAKLENRSASPVLANALGAGAPPLNSIAVFDSQLNGAGWGVGFTLGATLKPTSSTTIGIGFRSAVDLTLEGDVDLYNGELLVGAPTGLAPGGAVPGQSIEAEADVTLPEMITLSVAQDITERLTVMGTVEWTNWSRLDELRVKSQGSGRTLQLTTFDWNDGWYFAAGAEYDATERLTVRAGAGYEITPVPDSGRTVRITDEDRIWLSAGASFQATDRISIDLGYSHIFIEDGDINRPNSNEAGPGDGALFVGTAEDQSVDLFSLSANIQFGGNPIFAGRNSPVEGAVFKP